MNGTKQFRVRQQAHGTVRVRSGFTMVESLISLAISVVLLAALMNTFVLCNRLWHVTSLDISTVREGNSCLQQMIYGVGTGMGLRGAYWVTNTGSATNWSLVSSNYYQQIYYTYSPSRKTVTYSNATQSLVIGTNIVSAQVSVGAGGVMVLLTLQQWDGPFPDGNQMSSFVRLRAPKTQ